MKYDILKILKENQFGFLSGETLSKHFGVSRTTVWKCINEMIAEGYNIDASSKKGYRILESAHFYNEFELGYNLNTQTIGRKILFFDTLDSTNNYAKTIAASGCEDGTVIVAKNQTAGRGRLGRSWSSSGTDGIYFSVILKPDISIENVQIITLAAVVAVVEAIEATTGIAAGIKWPNDLVLDGKKVCGILTEMNSEMDKINFVVLGIGINFSQKPEDFDDEISDRAISLEQCVTGTGLLTHLPAEEGCVNNPVPVTHSKTDILREVLKKLDTVYQLVVSGNTAEIIEQWKKYSVTLGREVRVSSRNSEFIGLATDITNDGKLLVKCYDGRVEQVVSGEVSVRGIYGYV